ncbi:MAG TPA: glycosyltransferase family 4 protein [Patescibacteria group bacterium]|nr:glycosyltransferase family 4 protein [Patescibacteria group bacterium]
MNILLLNWRDIKNPKAGGAEIVTFEHEKAWAFKGHSVTWFTSGFPQSLAEEAIDGVKIIRKGTMVTVFFYAFLFYLQHRKQFDVVIDEIHGIPFFTPLYVSGPKITFIHEVAEEIWDYMYPFPINTVGKFLETFYLPLYKKIRLWTDAQSTIDDLVKFGFLRNNCFAIACPIKNTPLTKKPVKEKNKTFIFVSRVVRMKGIEEVIKSFGFIQKEDANAKLWIVGKGEEEYIRKLKSMAGEYHIEKNVTFFGEVSEKEKLHLMSKAHLLLHASVKEGWGLVVMEAASQWTPSVVYNVAGLKDSVKNNITGIVLEANSPSEMAKQAILLVNDKKRYSRFQTNGLSWVKSLSWEKATQQSLQLLESVARL